MRRNVQAAVATLAILARPLRVRIDHTPIEDPPSWARRLHHPAAHPKHGAALGDSIRVVYGVDGGASASIRMEAVNDSGAYEARIPRQPPGAGCLRDPRARHRGTFRQRSDRRPAAPYTFGVARQLVFADDFALDRGWTVGAPGDDATTGIWIRAAPVGTGAQPGTDASGDSASALLRHGERPARRRAGAPTSTAGERP